MKAQNKVLTGIIVVLLLAIVAVGAVLVVPMFQAGNGTDIPSSQLEATEMSDGGAVQEFRYNDSSSGSASSGDEDVTVHEFSSVE